VDEKPAVTKRNQDGTEAFEVNDEIATEQDEVDDAWTKAQKQMEINKTVTAAKSKRDDKTKNEDKTKQFRTVFLLSWIFCNAFLVVLFTNDFIVSKWFRGADGRFTNSTVILGVIFWSVAVLSLVRFIGCCVYLLEWWKEKIADAGAAQRYSPA
jgi:chitin synthase